MMEQITTYNYLNQHNKEHHMLEKLILIILKTIMTHTQHQALYKHSKKPFLIKLLLLIIE